MKSFATGVLLVSKDVYHGEDFSIYKCQFSDGESNLATVQVSEDDYNALQGLNKYDLTLDIGTIGFKSYIRLSSFDEVK